MTVATPALGDPVMAGGTRYRIRSLTGAVARLRAWDGAEATADARTFSWDATQRAWRADRCSPTR